MHAVINRQIAAILWDLVRGFEHKAQGVMTVGRHHPWARVWNLDESTLVTSEVETSLICRFGPQRHSSL